MSYSVIDTTGTPREITVNHKITAIDGVSQTPNLYIVEVMPFGHKPKVRPRKIDRVKITIAPFNTMSSAGVPTYGTPFDVYGDPHFKEFKRFDQEQSKDVLKSLGYFNFNSAPGSFSRTLIRAHFLDKLAGYAFLGQYAVAFTTVTYPARDWQGNLGTPTEVTRSITVDDVQTQAGFVTNDGLKLIEGQAILRIPRDQITLAELASIDNYFTITLQSVAVRYRIWNSAPKGFCIEHTHHYEVYLQRAL